MAGEPANALARLKTSQFHLGSGGCVHDFYIHEWINSVDEETPGRSSQALATTLQTLDALYL